MGNELIKPLFIYLLSPKVGKRPKTKYDYYDSCVVLAPSADKAVLIHPSEKAPKFWYKSEIKYGDWVYPDDLDCILLGKAIQGNGVKQGVVCSSFNAG